MGRLAVFYVLLSSLVPSLECSEYIVSILDEFSHY